MYLPGKCVCVCECSRPIGAYSLASPTNLMLSSRVLSKAPSLCGSSILIWCSLIVAPQALLVCTVLKARFVEVLNSPLSQPSEH